MLVSLIGTALVLLAGGLVGRIALIDFKTKKISNEHVVQVLLVALAIRVLEILQASSFTYLWVPAAASAALFAILIVFWLLGKVGAGDVKFLAIVPLLVGTGGLTAFMWAFLAFSVATYFVMKFPTLLPKTMFRTYVEAMASEDRVPFGVPIALATMVGLLFVLPLFAQAPFSTASTPWDMLQ